MQTSFNHLSNIQTYAVPLRGTHVADYRRSCAYRKRFLPTRLGSDLHKFLLHTELPPSSARLNLSEKLLSSSSPLQIYFILYYYIIISSICQDIFLGYFENAFIFWFILTILPRILLESA